MTTAVRQTVFLVVAIGLFVLGALGVRGLPRFGEYPGPYGDVINAVAVSERHVQNVVTAVIFDYRGFDTLGEEFILFGAVTGVVLLLRRESPEDKGECQDQRNPTQESAAQAQKQNGQRSRTHRELDPSEAVRLFSLFFVGLVVVLGCYVVLTGHLSVGGGFQGGVILSSAWLAAFFSRGPSGLRRFSDPYVAEWCEAGGAAAYGLIGASALLFGHAYLTNILPLGQTGQLLSSGTILLINCGVGVEVTAGFVLLYTEFVRPLEPEEPRRTP